ncbi:hypothetical protein GLOTRDRAFT_28091, partial [Gloeophyllum trabeum ATCC 11539]
PRALFSEMELQAMRWFAIKNGVETLPTVKQVKYRRSNIIDNAGVASHTREGRLGHLYTVNDWKAILQHQEMANPLVRPHLQFYPQDSWPRLSEACQAARWRYEIDGNLASPMARSNGKDYFVEEVCM